MKKLLVAITVMYCCMGALVAVSAETKKGWFFLRIGRLTGTSAP